MDEQEETRDPGGLPVSLRALRVALWRPTVWPICVIPILLAGYVVAQPWFNWFGRALGNKYAPGSVLANQDGPFRTDHSSAMSVLNSATATETAALAGLALLMGTFFAGGWLQIVLDRRRGRTARRFAYGGARHFWRFVRVLVLTLIGLSVAGWVIHDTPWKWGVEGLLFGLDGSREVLDSELTTRRLDFLQAGLDAVAFSLVLAWGTYTRTRLALHGTKSALWAGMCSGWLLVRHPVRTLRPLLTLFAFEAAVLLVLGAIVSSTERGLDAETTRTAIYMLGGLNVLALLWREIIRGARYAAAVQVTRDLLPPLSQPDPWSERVGGPGGPQYPIDDDGYGVSI